MTSFCGCVRCATGNQQPLTIESPPADQKVTDLGDQFEISATVVDTASMDSYAKVLGLKGLFRLQHHIVEMPASFSNR